MSDSASFAHPVERELARVFDEHGIEWSYEPHTFVLEQDPDGTVREAFTPDFFLPEIGVYVECTVQRQALTGAERRKARKARALLGVTVVILFRRDLDRLARRWGYPRLERALRLSSGGQPSLTTVYQTRSATSTTTSPIRATRR